MILPITNFKAKLILIPRSKGDKNTAPMLLENFTVGKKYRVYSIYDEGEGWTDFLVQDDSGMYCWINITLFKG